MRRNMIELPEKLEAHSGDTAVVVADGFSKVPCWEDNLKLRLYKRTEVWIDRDIQKIWDLEIRWHDPSRWPRFDGYGSLYSYSLTWTEHRWKGTWGSHWISDPEGKEELCPAKSTIARSESDSRRSRSYSIKKAVINNPSMKFLWRDRFHLTSLMNPGSTPSGEASTVDYGWRAGPGVFRLGFGSSKVRKTRCLIM